MNAYKSGKRKSKKRKRLQYKAKLGDFRREKRLSYLKEHDSTWREYEEKDMAL